MPSWFTRTIVPPLSTEIHTHVIYIIIYSQRKSKIRYVVRGIKQRYEKKGINVGVLRITLCIVYVNMQRVLAIRLQQL